MLTKHLLGHWNRNTIYSIIQEQIKGMLLVDYKKNLNQVWGMRSMKIHVWEEITQVNRTIYLLKALH